MVKRASNFIGIHAHLPVSYGLVGCLAGRTIRAPHRRSRQKKSPTRNLLERLWLGQSEVLAFLDDLPIPFDNNQAERDLRMLEVQQKISRCFRSSSGGDAFGRIRGYLSTLNKQEMKRLATLETVFTGRPLYPSFG